MASHPLQTSRNPKSACRKIGLCLARTRSPKIERLKCVLTPVSIIAYFYARLYAPPKNSGSVEAGWDHSQNADSLVKSRKVRMSPSAGKCVQVLEITCERDALPTELRHQIGDLLKRTDLINTQIIHENVHVGKAFCGFQCGSRGWHPPSVTDSTSATNRESRKKVPARVPANLVR